jgi:antitoxin component of MazEF toxin-antitoxin module
MVDPNPEMPTKFPFLGLKIQNSGSSKRVTIPADVVDDAELETGETVQAKYDREKGTLTFFLN